MTARTTTVARLKTRFAAGAKRFASDASGAPAMEYAIVATGLSIVIVGAVAVLGGDIEDLYQTFLKVFSD